MPREVKLYIDSIVEDLIRILLTTEDGMEKSIDIDVESLKKILKKEEIAVGRSYLITFKSEIAFDALTSEKIGEQFKRKGIKVKDTTRQDLAAIRKLQKKLGLKR